MARNLVVIALVILVLAVILLVLLVILILVVLIVLALTVLAVLRVVVIVVLIVVHNSSFPLPLWTLIVWQHLIPGALHAFAKLQPPVDYQLHEVVCQKRT